MPGLYLSTEKYQEFWLRIRETWRQLAARNNESFAAGSFQGNKDIFSSQAQAASSFNCAKSHVQTLVKLAS